MGLMDLIKPKWKHSKASVRYLAVKKLTDQAVLAEIATHDESSDVREAAVSNRYLADQALLGTLANNDRDSGVRVTAATRLNDKSLAQAIIGDIATRGEHARDRQRAVDFLVDQAVLARIAKTDTDGSVRQAAADQLNDQALAQTIYFDIATTCDWPCGRTVVNNPKFTDQTLWAKIAKNENVLYLVRQDVVARLTDQAVLAEVARKDDNSNVRMAAVLNPYFTNLAILLEIANAVKYSELGGAIERKIGNMHVCKAFQNGHCIGQRTGKDTGPCSWDPYNWKLCAVVDETLRFYGSW